MEWLAGIGAFALFFLYDWNRIFWKNRWMTSFFSVGCIILAVMGVLFIWEAFQSGRGLRLLWLIPAAASLCALIYALFFALPFDDTYRKEAAGGGFAAPVSMGTAAIRASWPSFSAFYFWVWRPGSGSWRRECSIPG